MAQERQQAGAHGQAQRHALPVVGTGDTVHARRRGAAAGGAGALKPSPHPNPPRRAEGEARSRVEDLRARHFCCGAGVGGKIFSKARPIASSLRSEPAGPSSSMPTGNPSLVRPTGNVNPGIPALLPGSVLRMKVWNVGTCLPLSVTF